MAKPSVKHHDSEEITEAFAFDPYEVSVWTAQDQTVVEYWTGGEHVASFVIRLMEDGGTVWTSAWVRPDHQGQGIYTHLHKWSLTQPSSVILAEGAQTDMYLRSGYKEERPGVLKFDAKESKKWLKGR